MRQHSHSRVMAPGLLMTAVAVLFLWPGASAAANELSAIRHWSSPTSTRMVLDLKQRATYKIAKQTTPEKLVVDILDVTGAVPLRALPINDGIVKTVTAARINSDTIRITIELAGPASHKIFPLERFMDKPPRLAIDIVRPDLEQADKAERQQTRKLKQQQVRIVVIDAGHGGEDPGAIGPGKTMEKDIVLAIARKTVQLLNRKPDIKAYLTRKGDYFIPLGTRMSMAQEYGADLFISIHADSSFSTKIHGTSIYCLSLKSASSAAAQILAQKENDSDSVGGVPLEHHNDDLNAILIDLVQTNTLNTSIKCAGIMIQEIAKINRLRTDQPQQAGFKVLKNPDVTSMLIETDFLSNPKKEKKLRSEQFQGSLAGAIASAVKKYFAESYVSAAAEPTPSAQAAAPALSAEAPPLLHTVEKGETLSGIAQKYNMSMKEICALNDLSPEKNLLAGKKLKVKQAEMPAVPKRAEAVPEKTAEQAPAQASLSADTPSRFHTVAAGETLYSIARKHRMSVKQLCALNDLSPEKNLLAGKKLKVKQAEMPAVPKRAEAVPEKTAEQAPAQAAAPALSAEVPPQLHTVEKGETLSGIAQKYNMSMKEICALNDLSPEKNLLAGKKLKVKQAK